MNVLIVGGGGRCHAIAYTLKKSKHVTSIHALPGNPGISEIGTCHSGSVEDFETVLKVVEENNIDLTAKQIRFSIKPSKLFIFNKETEERIYLEEVK